MPARWSRNSYRSRVYNLLSLPDAFILRTDITDHYPIALRFHCLLLKTHTPSMKSLFNKVRFSEQIANANWSSVCSCEDAQISYTKFSSIVGKCISAATTVVSCKKQYASPQCPWIMQSLLKSLRKKDNLYRKTKRQPYNTSLKERYKRYSNMLSLLLCKAKRSYFEKQIILAGNNSAKQWRVINSFLNKNTNNNSIPEVHDDGKVFYDPVDIANAFSSYFSQPPPAPTTLRLNNPRHVSQSFFLTPFFPVAIALSWVLNWIVF